MSGVLLAMLAYVLVQFVIGVVVSRQMANEADYILAGRQLGAFLVAFSVVASFFGAYSIVGGLMADSVTDVIQGIAVMVGGMGVWLVAKFTLGFHAPYLLALAAATALFLALTRVGRA